MLEGTKSCTLYNGLHSLAVLSTMSYSVLHSPRTFDFECSFGSLVVGMEKLERHTKLAIASSVSLTTPFWSL